MIENIDFDFDRMNRSAIHIGYYDGARTSIAIRNNEIHNLEAVPSTGRPVIRLIHEHNNDNLIRNVFIYKNHFHHLGEGRTLSTQRDITAVSLDQNVRDVWIVDNTFHHIGGDGVQIATDTPDEHSVVPNHVYIGRNVFHDTFENAVDLKKCEDVVISQNAAYDYGPTYSAVGGSSPFRYGGGEGGDDPRGRARIWTIFNRVYRSDSADGAFLSYSDERNPVEPFADEIYYIGNIVYDCKTAFSFWNQQRVYIVGNTTYNCSTAGSFFGHDGANDQLTLVNNLFSRSGTGIRGTLTIGTQTPARSYVDRLVMSHNLFHEVGIPASVSLHEWNEVRQRLEYTKYTLYELSRYRPDMLVGSIEGDPRFAAPEHSDFSLLSTSPAIDAGIVPDIYARFYELYGVDIRFDFSNNPAPEGRKCDLGAYEYRDGPFEFGDVSGDGLVTAYDASLAARAAQGLLVLSGGEARRADVTGDLLVSNEDVSWIARAAVGEVLSLSVEQ